VKRLSLFDGLINLVTGLGLAGKDKAVNTAYALPQYNLDAFISMYRSSWSARRVVDVPIEDMLREWRTWDDVALADVEPRYLRVKRSVEKALKLAAQTGGAVLYLGMDVESPDVLREPLNLTKLQKDQLTYLLPIGRDELSVAEYDRDPMSPRYQKGRLYTIDRGDAPHAIHHTRFVWFRGKDVPSRHAELQDGWDDPVFVGLEPLIKNADVAVGELATMLQEAKVDIYGIEDLANMLSDSESEALLIKRMQLTHQMKSTQQAVIRDNNDNYDQKTMTFAGVVDVARASLEALAGAADIPITRFLGASPGGLNATGDSDFRNYYDGLASRQENELTDALWALDTALLANAGLPLDTAYTWNPLWQLSAKERAELRKEDSIAWKNYAESMLFDPAYIAALAVENMKQGDAYAGVDAALELVGEDSYAALSADNTES